MIRLTREVRFALNEMPGSDLARDGRHNRWSCWPRMVGVRPYVRLRVTLSGELNPSTGYLCNIKLVDDLVQETVVETLSMHASRGKQASELTAIAFAALSEKLPEEVKLENVELVLTPYLKYSKKSEDEKMSRVTQQFEFSATHRLHCEHLSDEENRRIFGKCNNPNGHGHNYVVEVTVDVDDQQQDINVMVELETAVMSEVIDRFDHKNLNVEVEQFASLNPTVENIAGVIWDLLDGKFVSSQLANVRVYETPKTWADYSNLK